MLELSAATINLPEVADIIVSEAVDDGTGNYVREFKFFGTGITGTSATPLLLTVRVTGTTKAAIDVTAPPLSF